MRCWYEALSKKNVFKVPSVSERRSGTIILLQPLRWEITTNQLTIAVRKCRKCSCATRSGESSLWMNVNNNDRETPRICTPATEKHLFRIVRKNCASNWIMIVTMLLCLHGTSFRPPLRKLCNSVSRVIFPFQLLSMLQSEGSYLLP